MTVAGCNEVDVAGADFLRGNCSNRGIVPGSHDIDLKTESNFNVTRKANLMGEPEKQICIEKLCVRSNLGADKKYA